MSSSYHTPLHMRVFPNYPASPGSPKCTRAECTLPKLKQSKKTVSEAAQSLLSIVSTALYTTRSSKPKFSVTILYGTSPTVHRIPVEKLTSNTKQFFFSYERSFLLDSDASVI